LLVLSGDYIRVRPRGVKDATPTILLINLNYFKNIVGVKQPKIQSCIFDLVKAY